jgi:hypothetical protein
VAVAARAVNAHACGEQCSDSLGVARDSRHAERHVSVCVLHVLASVRGEQSAHHAHVVARRRQRQRPVACPVDGLHVSVALQQQRDQRLRTRGGCKRQCCAPSFRSGVHARAGVQRRRGCRDVARCSSRKQARVTLALAVAQRSAHRRRRCRLPRRQLVRRAQRRACVPLGALGQQQHDQARVASARRQRQRRDAVARRRARVRATRQQQLRHAFVAAQSGAGQRGVTIKPACLELGARI